MNIDKDALNLKWLVISEAYKQYKASGSIISLKIPYLYMLNKNHGITKATLENVFRGLDKEGCFRFIQLGSENALVEEVNEEKLDTTYGEIKLLIENTDTVSCGSLKLNLSKGYISYEDYQLQNISVTENGIRFLDYLLRNPNRIVTYLELAKYLDINKYNEDSKNDDAEIKDTIQRVKSDLFAFLKNELHIPEEELNKALRPIEKKGYKLICNNL